MSDYISQSLRLLVLASLLVLGLPATATFDQQIIGRGVVAVVGTARDGEQRYASGMIVHLSRQSGFVVTEGALVASSESVNVVAADGVSLMAQTIRLDGKGDVAVLKVNGLAGQALRFANAEPIAGDVVWSAFTWPAQRQLGLSKGTVRQLVAGRESSYGSVSHTAVTGAVTASVLLNDCGEVVGYSGRPPRTSEPRMTALAGDDLQGILDALAIAPAVAAAECLSEVAVARNKAELAATQAQKAQLDATRAQEAAAELAGALERSNERNRALEQQSLRARQQADAAVATADRAEKDAEATRLELEDTKERILEETQAMVRTMEQNRAQAEARLKDALRHQSERADSNEQMLIIIGGLLGLMLVAGLLIVLIRKATQSRPARAPGLSRPAAATNAEATEYVLDGRDEDGIRYLLRISGDQLIDDAGVVIGRNPKDSPYIINHSDVSRKHARMRVVQSKVFIEDLGSTNGTLVNGQAIEDKGPVTVAHGDQIAIGSVVMKLRVLDQ